eukprot:543841_1
MADKDKRLDVMGKQKDNMSDKEKKKQNEMDKLRKELEALRKAKNKQFDNFVDKKAEMDKKLRDKDISLHTPSSTYRSLSCLKKEETKTQTMEMAKRGQVNRYDSNDLVYRRENNRIKCDFFQINY